MTRSNLYIIWIALHTRGSSNWIALNILFYSRAGIQEDFRNKDDYLKDRYKTRLKGYIKEIEKLKKEKVNGNHNVNTTILDALYNGLKDRIENHWMEGSPFNKKCKTNSLPGAKRFCKSDGTMTCCMYFDGNHDIGIPRNETYSRCRGPRKHQFNPYNTRIERIILRLFTLDHM